MNLPPSDPLERSARVLYELSSVPRLRIALLLQERGPLRVTAIASALDMEIAHASQQLARLHEAGLLDREPRKGPYRLAADPLWEAVHPLLRRRYPTGSAPSPNARR